MIAETVDLGRRGGQCVNSPSNKPQINLPTGVFVTPFTIKQLGQGNG